MENLQSRSKNFARDTLSALVGTVLVIKLQFNCGITIWAYNSCHQEICGLTWSKKTSLCAPHRKQTLSFANVYPFCMPWRPVLPHINNIVETSVRILAWRLCAASKTQWQCGSLKVGIQSAIMAGCGDAFSACLRQCYLLWLTNYSRMILSRMPSLVRACLWVSTCGVRLLLMLATCHAYVFRGNGATGSDLNTNFKRDAAQISVRLW